MRKITSLVLVLSVLLAIVACSKDIETYNSASPKGDIAEDGLQLEPGAELLVWASKEDLPFMNAVSKQFTEKHGVPVTIQEVGAGDTLNKLTTDGPAQIGADLVTFTNDHLGKAVVAGLVLPNDVWQEDTQDANKDNIIQAVSYGNILYGYPLSIEAPVMFYNKQLVPDPPATFDEVVEFAKGYNDPEKAKFALMWEIENFYFNYIFIATTGGYVFGNNGVNFNDIGLNNEGAAEGVAYYGSLKERLLPVRTGDVTYDIKKGQFLGDQLAMNIDGPWIIGELKKDGDKYGAVPIPSINGKPSVSFSGLSHGMSIPIRAIRMPPRASLISHQARKRSCLIFN